MNANKIMCLVFVIALMSSCSNAQLTRQNTKKQIIENLDYPQNELHELVVQDQSIYRYMFVKRWKKYADLGLLTINQYNGGVSTFLTRTGEKYRSQGKTRFGGSILVKEAELHFLEITGIKNEDYRELGGGLTTYVEYTIERRNITSFGKANNRKLTIIEKHATFVKYDGGWRLQKK